MRQREAGRDNEDTNDSQYGQPQLRTPLDRRTLSRMQRADASRLCRSGEGRGDAGQHPERDNQRELCRAEPQLLHMHDEIKIVDRACRQANQKAGNPVSECYPEARADQPDQCCFQQYLCEDAASRHADNA